jgi:hypothetical protein
LAARRRPGSPRDGTGERDHQRQVLDNVEGYEREDRHGQECLDDRQPATVVVEPSPAVAVDQWRPGELRHPDQCEQLDERDPLQRHRDSGRWFAFVLLACAVVCFNTQAGRAWAAAT